jgi:spore germination protein GerM
MWVYQRDQRPTPTPSKPEGATLSPQKQSASLPPKRREAPVASILPLKEALTQVLKKNPDNLFPKGTSLHSVTVEGGVATLDFSSEFQALQDSGESTEAEAQNALRQVVAKYPSIEKMRVQVEGRGFVSQATDWSIPFSVR